MKFIGSLFFRDFYQDVRDDGTNEYAEHFWDLKFVRET